LIDSNKKIIKDSPILDLASYDGRWSFAAIKNGAKRVLGIEFNENALKRSFEIFKRYEIDSEKYSFIEGDIFEKIKELKPREFDVVFCFGVFYHIMDHMLLLKEIKRLQVKYLILDTEISTSNSPIIQIREQRREHKELPITDSLGNKQFIRGTPSKPALEMMLKSVGFDFVYYDWENSGITNWEDIEEYRSRKSVSIKKTLRFGKSILHFKNKRKTFQGDIQRFLSKRRISLVIKNISQS